MSWTNYAPFKIKIKNRTKKNRIKKRKNGEKKREDIYLIYPSFADVLKLYNVAVLKPTLREENCFSVQQMQLTRSSDKLICLLKKQYRLSFHRGTRVSAKLFGSISAQCKNLKRATEKRR